MQQTDELLKSAINLHYRDHSNVVIEATCLIESYCKNQQTIADYDRLLKTLHDLMNDLPSNILLYFLTTVPFPNQNDGKTSTFADLMKKSRISLLESINSVLLEYLSSPTPLNTEGRANLACLNDSGSNNNPCKNLVEICAEYVVTNLQQLQQLYQQKNDLVWKLINNNIYAAVNQKQYYVFIADINKKQALLRMIEAKHVTVDMIMELYGNSEILMKKSQQNDAGGDSESDIICKELQDAITKFIDV